MTVDYFKDYLKGQILNTKFQSVAHRHTSLKMGQQVSKQYKKLPFAYIQKSDDLQDSPLSTSSVFSAPHSTVDNASTSVLNFDDEDFLENKGQITFQMLINTNSIGLCSQKIIGINRNIGLLQQTERLQL